MQTISQWRGQSPANNATFLRRQFAFARIGITLAAGLTLAAAAVAAPEVNLKWLASDASKDLSGYMPQRLKLVPEAGVVEEVA